MDPQIPHEARATAIVLSDTTADLIIDGGTETLTASDEVDVRAEIINRVTATARGLGRPARLDIHDAQGLWPLLVHPSGQVDSAGDFVPTSASNPAPRSSGSRRDNRARETSSLPRPTAPESLVFSADWISDAPTVERRPAAAVPAQPEDTRPAAEPVIPPAPRTGDRDPASTSALGAPPTLEDLLKSRPPEPVGLAEEGWRRAVRVLTGGLIAPAPSAAEIAHRTSVAAVRRSLGGPKTIVVVNPKGGAHKTTATLLIAATFGIYRGGYTLAWDNTETRGTLGWRANRARHSNTAVDLLRDLDRFRDHAGSRVGDLDNYVRSQGSAQFDVLASDEDAAASSTIDAAAFTELHSTLSRFYRVIVVDTGNNMRASNWEAAVAAADQLVIVSTIREDTAASAAWLIDGLLTKGHHDTVSQAVTVLSSPSSDPDPALSERLRGHFSQLTRAVVRVPHDPALVSGGPLYFETLAPQTREAWLRASAAIADGL